MARQHQRRVENWDKQIPFRCLEFFRNTSLDANDFFLNEAGKPRPRIQQNIFGADAGGPVGRKAAAWVPLLELSGPRQRAGGSPGTLINATIRCSRTPATRPL